MRVPSEIKNTLAYHGGDWSALNRHKHYSRLGKARAAFWATLGHPNLRKGTATLQAKAAARRAEREREKAELVDRLLLEQTRDE